MSLWNITNGYNFNFTQLEFDFGIYSSRMEYLLKVADISTFSTNIPVVLFLKDWPENHMVSNQHCTPSFLG